jgi:hypothetical protein
MDSKEKLFFDFRHKKIICESSKPKKPNVNHMRLWHHGNHKKPEQHNQNNKNKVIIMNLNLKMRC